MPNEKKHIVKYQIRSSKHKAVFNMEPFADIFRDYLQTKGIKMTRNLQSKDEL